MTDDLTGALNRAADEPAAEPKKSSRKPDLAAENAELKARLDKMEQLLMSMAPAASATAEPKRDELDRSRPFAKTRTMGGGVTFEQDGRIFNARGQLMVAEA